MTRRWPVALIVVAALAACLPATAEAKPRSETRTEAELTATLSWDETRRRQSNLRLSIAQGGIVLHDAAIRPRSRTTPLTLYRPGRSLKVRDLDGDGEAEVLVDLYTEGAHCCFYTEIFRFEREAPSYVRSRHDWGNGGYRLRDLDDDDPGVEIVSRDDGFAYAFASYADSAYPIRILRFTDGSLTNVTRRFRPQIRRDARRLLRRYRRTVKQRRDVRGVLAAYVADQYLLRRPSRGWRVLRRALRQHRLRDPHGGKSWPTGRRYIRALRRFLRRAGYRR
jgi:hypothetical protein